MTCVAERSFDSERSNFELKEGVSYKWRIGFNVYEGEASDVRLTYGASDTMELHLFEMGAITTAVAAVSFVTLASIF